VRNDCRAQADVVALSRWLGVGKSTIYTWINTRKVEVTCRAGFRWSVYLVFLDSLPARYLAMLEGKTVAELEGA